ncbi:MAG: HAMP domain-containing histidine kinase [Planctomycetes bacterium]|nr:HAMP domain-containing histidine kinase [Planctomycetota bacterium]
MCRDLLAAEAATLSRLIQRILDFSRMEEGTKAFRFQPVRLADVLARAIEPFRAPPGPSRSGLAGLAVSLDVPADLPPIVADPQALEEVLWNLLSNAKKYSPDGGEVEVSARAASGECRIAVRDRGIGIPARFREKIFEKFFRIEDDRTVAVEGTGLGLAIVRHIVRAHRGRVEVESVPGEGSTFTVVLPVGGKGGSAGTGTGTGTGKGKESWKPS